MQIGTDHISSMQHRILDRVRNRTNILRELIDGLRTLTNDNDILTGKEDVHPEWMSIFEANRDRIQNSLPSLAFESFRTFFEGLIPLDQSLKEIDPKSITLSFLLGAGASKPEPSNIPTVKELLPQLLERARRLDRDDVTKLADFCEMRKIDNIEDLLTAAQLATFCSRNPIVLQLINYLLYGGQSDEPYDIPSFVRSWGSETIESTRSRRSRDPVADLSSVAFLQDTLQVLFGLLSSTMLPATPNPAHEAIMKYVREQSNSSIVTTNYDCCMDLALGNVGKDLEYGIEFKNATHDTSPGNQCTRLIKLHGSLNWFYCETCQDIQLVDIREMVNNFLDDKALYPVIGICKGCGGQRRGLLVPPLAMKFDLAPPLTPLVGNAKATFDTADLIVVIGFSFADADIYISRMLIKSMQTKAGQKLLIMDPDERIVAKVRRKFKASIPNFDEGRIIRATGNCAEILPRFLEGQYFKTTEPLVSSRVLSDDDNANGQQQQE